jgi:peroxin-1
MARTAVVHFVPLKNCLANLPLSLHAPLQQRGVVRLSLPLPLFPISRLISLLFLPSCSLKQPPQSIAVSLSYRESIPGHPPVTHSVVVGWTGLPASPAPPALQQQRGQPQQQDRIEIDPQFAAMLGGGLKEGTQVRFHSRCEVGEDWQRGRREVWTKEGQREQAVAM